MNSKFNYIIYHNRCFDGYTGFYLFMKTDKWAKKPIVYPDVPSAKTVPPDINGKNIIIIDVAYKAHIIKKIAEKCNKLLFIDHHISIKDDIKELKLKKPHEVIYDVNECGATLTWKYFYKTKKMPQFVKYIRDNDIGKWEIKETLPFISFLEVNFELNPDKNTLNHWDKLLDKKYLKNAVDTGVKYNEYKNHLIKYNSKQNIIRQFPGPKFKHISTKKYNVAVLNNKCPSLSLLGKYVVNNVKCDFALLWSYNMKAKKYIIGLRSNKADISGIAKALGGGGHKLASGCAIDATKYTIDDLFMPLNN